MGIHQKLVWVTSDGSEFMIKSEAEGYEANLAVVKLAKAICQMGDNPQLIASYMIKCAAKIREALDIFDDSERNYVN